MTNDYNLNKIARLQGVEVINLNDLANAMKPIVLPGEGLTVKLIKRGEEQGQGVGYLDDGTMVVAEQGSYHLGEIVRLTVTSVLQTSAGRMIFGRIEPTPAGKTSEQRELAGASRKPRAQHRRPAPRRFEQLSSPSGSFKPQAAADLSYGLTESMSVLDEGEPQAAFARLAEPAARAHDDVRLFKQFHGEVDRAHLRPPGLGHGRPDEHARPGGLGAQPEPSQTANQDIALS